MLEDRGNLGSEALSRAANALVSAANKDSKVFQDVFTPFNAGSPVVYADIDREKAEKLGLKPTDVFSTLQFYMGSQYVNDFNYLGRTFQVIAQGDQEFRQTPDAIERLKVRNAEGDMVPLGSVTTLKERTEPYRIPRYNLYPAAEVQGVPAAGVSSGTAMEQMEALARRVLPKGIELEWTDMSFQQKKKGVPTLLIFGASALFVFLVLAAQYESWKTPLSIVLIVPMCLLPAAVGLFLRDMPIDILAQIGFVVLVGLAAKNAILIVEFARQRQDEDGFEAEEAAVNAAQTRLRPILMTSLAFILGVVPLAVATGAGAEMRQSIGTAVLFGMLGVTLFGLVFIPAFYTMVRKLGDLQAAARYLEVLRSRVALYGFVIWHECCESLAAQLDILGGRTAQGLARLEVALDALVARGFRRLLTPAIVVCAETLAVTGRKADATARLDEALKYCNGHGEHFFMPEIWRAMGMVALAQARLASGQVSVTRYMVRRHSGG